MFSKGKVIERGDGYYYTYYANGILKKDDQPYGTFEEAEEAMRNLITDLNKGAATQWN